MTDPFEELLDIESMSRINETATGRETAPAPAHASVPSPEHVRDALSGRHVCPYCGLQSPESNEACPRCRMEDTPGSRQATKVRIGPWYVLQSRNPAAPGMRYSTLLTLIGKGSVLPQSVVRGPTTHQLWRYAAHVRGVSREFGMCYSCGGGVDRAAVACTYCGRSQEPPAEPDVLVDVRNGSAVPSPVSAPEQVAPEAPPPANIVPTSVPVPAEGTFSNRMRELSRQRAEQDARSTGLATVQRSQRQPLARSGDERVVSAMDLAAALQDDPNRFVGESQRWGFFKTAASVLIFAGIVGGAVLLVKPEYQGPTKKWVNDQWASVKGMANRAITSPPAPVPSYDRPITLKSTSPRTIAAVPESSPKTSVEPAPAPVVQAPVEAPEQRVTVARTPPQPTPAAPAAQPSQPDRGAAMNMAREYYRQAIDAEQKEDFAAAIRFYEQIEKLPNDAWPADLRIRMTIVRQQATQSSAQ